MDFITEKDKEKTTFTAEESLYQFRKMLQGFKNSLEIFQREITLILEGLMNKACLVYVDDILIFGVSLEEHDSNLYLVKQRIKGYGLKI